MKKITLIAIILIVDVIIGAIVVYNLRVVNTLRGTGNESTATSFLFDVIGREPLTTPQSSTVDKPDTEDSGVQPIPGLSRPILELFSPLPDKSTPTGYQITDELVHLGRILFYDPRLSASQKISCNTCHLLDEYGVDHRTLSMGHDENLADRNSPTVYNSAFHFKQFWDGRSNSVEEQAIEPILSSREMNMKTPENVMQVLRSIPEYADLFAAAYPGQLDPFTLENVAKALGAFERGLIIPSRVDAFINGDYTILTEQEQRGMATFARIGCARCHNGATIGGQSYQKLGDIIPYPVEDQGLFEITGIEEDRQVFKVPSLRNVAQTAPYLHDGSISTLDEMVVFMARHQLGKELTQDQVADIIAFLKSLTGEIPTDYIDEPPLPASGIDTPDSTSSE